MLARLHWEQARPAATSAPGAGSPLPTSALGLGSPPPTSAPGVGLPRPHLRRDWGSPPPTSAPGASSPLPASAPGPAQMWTGCAQSRRRCGRGEPSPGADVGRGEPMCFVCAGGAGHVRLLPADRPVGGRRGRGARAAAVLHGDRAAGMDARFRMPVYLSVCLPRTRARTHTLTHARTRTRTRARARFPPIDRSIDRSMAGEPRDVGDPRVPPHRAEARRRRDPVRRRPAHGQPRRLALPGAAAPSGNRG